ncbi:hypothetical protein PIB30_038942 [Stylosanthes scabra]|uniref:Uncharacterized protein n=1 Tax=Stylosanthes scabra TaxID=79078 RepID=A0ABU6TG84_9FABA|nr:hypothetical protein [Stylosanthes scabra]
MEYAVRSNRAETRTVNLIDGTGLALLDIYLREYENIEMITKIFRTRKRTPTLKIWPETDQTERKRVEKERAAWRCGGGYYLPSTSGGHNFHIRAPIDAPFAATRSLSLPLRI